MVLLIGNFHMGLGELGFDTLNACIGMRAWHGGPILAHTNLHSYISTQLLQSLCWPFQN
jgi:hypothetical protein